MACCAEEALGQEGLARQLMRYLIAALIAALLIPVGNANAALSTKERKKRAEVHRVFPFCNTWKCVKRVRTKRLALEWAYYKKNPMPYCTWGPESDYDPATGISYRGRPWAVARYRIKNPHSTASGKFQFLTSTWLNFGGGQYASEARHALPVYQERMARKLMRDSIKHWVNC